MLDPATQPVTYYNLTSSIKPQILKSQLLFFCSLHFSNSNALKSLGLACASAAAPSSSSSSLEGAALLGLVLLGHTAGHNPNLSPIFHQTPIRKPLTHRVHSQEHFLPFKSKLNSNPRDGSSSSINNSSSGGGVCRHPDSK